MDKKKIIQLVLAVLILVFSALSWYLIKNSFAQAQSEEWVRSVLWPSLSLVALGSFIGLAHLVEDDWRLLLGLLLLIGAPFFIFFISLNYWKLAFIGVALLFIFKGIYQSRRAKTQKIKLVLAEVLLKGLAPTVTGLTLLASIGFFGSAYAQSMAKAEIIIPRGLFNKIIDPLLNAPNTLKNLSGAPASGQPSGESEQFKDSLYQEINKYLNTTGSPFKKILPFGLATTFFFAMRIWGIVLMRLAAMLGWAWFGVLRLLKFARIAKVSVEKEVIEI